MKIRPDKHTCIFSSLHHEKNCYLFSFHILGFQSWMRKEAVRKPDLFLPHPEPSSGDGGRNESAGEDGVERMSFPLLYLNNC